MLSGAFQSYMQSRPYFPTSNLSSAFLAWFSHLHSIFKAGVSKYLNSVAFLAGSTFLSVVSSLIYGHLLHRNSSFHLCVPGYFSNRRVSPVLLNIASNPWEILQEIRIVDRLFSSCVK